MLIKILKNFIINTTTTNILKKIKINTDKDFKKKLNTNTERILKNYYKHEGLK